MSSDRQAFHICLRHGLQSHSRAPRCTSLTETLLTL